MKKTLILCVTGLICLFAYAQNDDRVLSISAIQPEDTRYSEEARQSLETKMQRLIQSGGLLSGEGSRFVMTSRIDVTEKDVTSQGMFLQKMNVSFYVLDVLEDRVFGMATVPVVGVGETETKALIKAFQNIKPTNPALTDFLAKSKIDIQNYFKQEISRILSDADYLANTGDFDGAYRTLLTVPSFCEAEYNQCRTKATEIYGIQREQRTEAVNKEGRKLIQEARSLWTQKQDHESAEKALSLLSKVDPDAECLIEANDLVNAIGETLRTTEKAEAEFKMRQYEEQWQFKMRQYEDRTAMERQKEENRTAVLNTLASRFGRLDINVQKDKTYRFGGAKNN